MEHTHTGEAFCFNIRRSKGATVISKGKIQPSSAREKSDRHPEQSEGSEKRFFTAFRMTAGEVQNDMVDVRNDEGEIQAMRLPSSAREKSNRHPEQSEGSGIDSSLRSE